VKRSTLTMLVAVGLMCASTQVGIADDEGWISLFDGKTLSGWKKAEENPGCVEGRKTAPDVPRQPLPSVLRGRRAAVPEFRIRGRGEDRARQQLGDLHPHGVPAEGWPKQGYEVQVNNTHRDPVKTGSLYGVVKVLEAPAKDDEWFKMSIRVEGKQVTVKVDGKTLVEYTEPEGKQAGGDFARVLGGGTFALQAHDPQSKVYFRNLRVKKLP
jgi:hypothetical protein